MRPRSAAILASRIIALWIGIEAATVVISLIVTLAQSQGVGAGYYWAIIGVRALFALILWTQAEGIGSAIAQGTADEGPAVTGRTANIHAVAISIVGIIFSIEGLTGLIGTAASAAEEPFPSRFTLIPGGFGSRGGLILVEVVTLGIGLTLLFGAGGIARSLSRSYPEPEAPPPPPFPPAS